jgi:hypothetical protein
MDQFGDDRHAQQLEPLWSRVTSPGSGFRASPDAHSFWFGQPAQPSAFPANSDWGPIHPVGKGVLLFNRTGFPSRHRTVAAEEEPLPTDLRWPPPASPRRRPCCRLRVRYKSPCYEGVKGHEGVVSRYSDPLPGSPLLLRPPDVRLRSVCPPAPLDILIESARAATTEGRHR